MASNPFDRSIEKQVKRELSMKGKPRDNRRDVFIHAAVTLTHHQDGIEIVGESTQDLAEFRCDFPFRAVPITEDNVRRHFAAMAEKCITRMRVYGLLK